MKRLLGPLLLFLTAMLWGAGFPAQKLGMNHTGPFFFTVLRNVLAGAFLLFLLHARRTLRPAERGASIFGRREWVGGFRCGVALWVPSMLQQLGICGTSPGTCAFLTANYVLFVPLLGLFVGRLPHWFVWPGVALSMVGTFLICMPVGGGFAMGVGEALSLLCAVGYAVQMLVVARQVEGARVVALSCIQFFIGAALGLPFLLLPSESPFVSVSCVRAALPAIAYCGLVSSGVAYTLQNVGQAMVAPAPAAILLSLESVFGALFGWIFCGDDITPRKLLGYALVFSAVLFTQLFDLRKSRG